VVDWGYPLTMKARQLIDGASFAPDALKAIGQAFDEAWAQIAPNFGNDPINQRRATLVAPKALKNTHRTPSARAKIARAARAGAFFA
jgi:hypothetical protein